jgi:hypothetical protein
MQLSAVGLLYEGSRRAFAGVQTHATHGWSIMHQSRTKIAKCALMVAPLLALGLGLPAPGAPAADSPPAASAERSGEHDFDFLFGRWKVHLKRKVTGTDRWTESDGYGIYRKVWGGRANLNEFFTENPNDRVEGLTLRTYNGVTHLWSLYWANSRDGILSSAQVGKFDHGQGEFYAQDNADGKGTLLRYVWSKITPTSAHFEQAFSENGGRSWEVNWISDMVRIGDAEDATSLGAGTVDEQPGQRDFEPLLGRWRFHLKARPALSGSTQCACIGPTAGTDSSWCRKSDSTRRVMASSTRRTCSMTKASWIKSTGQR